MTYTTEQSLSSNPPKKKGVVKSGSKTESLCYDFRSHGITKIVAKLHRSTAILPRAVRSVLPFHDLTSYAHERKYACIIFQFIFSVAGLRLSLKVTCDVLLGLLWRNAPEGQGSDSVLHLALQLLTSLHEQGRYTDAAEKANLKINHVTRLCGIANKPENDNNNNNNK